jgi:hypothetical protein
VIFEAWAVLDPPPAGGRGATGARLAALVEDGFVEAYDHADLGTEYRLHPDWGERLSRLTVASGEQAGLN